MADIKFKISGNSQPFLVCYGNNPLVLYKAIDYSGTCVVLGGLDYNSTYYVSVGDNIGNQKSFSYTTPASVTPTTLATKNINFVGTYCNPNNLVCVASNTISFTPELSVGESVILHFSGNTNPTPLGANDSLSLSYKKSGSNTSYPIYSTTNSGAVTIPAITLNYGCALWYNLTVACDNACDVKYNPYMGTTCGCSSLKLVSASSSSFIPNIVDNKRTVSFTYTPPTTTTTISINITAFH